MKRILIIEDDPDIAELVRRYLEKAAFAVDVKASGREGLVALTANPPDLLVLDLMLPHVGGGEICRAARANPATALIPIIMLTARGGGGRAHRRFRDRRRRLHREAVQPQRARGAGPRAAEARRTRPRCAGVDRLWQHHRRHERHTVEAAGQPVTLTAKEFLLLNYLLNHRGRVLSRDLLLTDVWGYKYTGGTRTVDVHVRRLREKLPPLEAALVTVKQFGYKLLEEPPKERPQG
jgi:DNA-binding response OmpR family regulator